MAFLSRTCRSERMNVQRILARFFVLVGIVFTFWMGFGSQYAYEGQPIAVASAYGLLFSGGLIIVFLVGLFYENIAAMLLVLGAMNVVAWGLLADWPSGSWAAMAFLIIIPMLLSAVLYVSASRMQFICESETER